MKPTKIEGATGVLSAPRDWDAHAHGECDALHIRVEQQQDSYLLHSAWMPSEAERAAIAAGQPIILTVWGRGHPPVSLNVQGVA